MCTNCQQIKRERLKTEAAATKITEIFTGAVDQVTKDGKPLTFRISCRGGPSTATSVLPSITLLRLLSCASLTSLEIAQWTLPSVDALFSDMSKYPAQHRLQTLLLPLEDAVSPGINLTTLHLISQCFPELCTLQSRFTLNPHGLHLSENYVSHGLKKLVVNGGSPISMEDKLDIAPYIYFLFPQLEEIAVVGTKDAEDWNLIHKLVKMCQKVQGCGKTVRKP